MEGMALTGWALLFILYGSCGFSYRRGVAWPCKFFTFDAGASQVGEIKLQYVNSNVVSSLVAGDFNSI